jgi:Ser/Thr protein kinase RdoA (MazF antagonist)
VIDVADRTLLLEYVPNGDLPASEQAGFSVGSSSARLHAHHFPTPGFLNDELEVVTPFASALEVLFEWVEAAFDGAAGRRLGTMVSAIRRLWDENAEQLDAVCRSPVLIHSDFKVSNLKWVPDEQQALILDWEFAWAGPSLFDIGQLLRWNPPPPFLRGFKRGYRANGGALPENWRHLAELLDLLNLVDFLNREPPDPVRNGDVARRIRQTLNG